jgi:nucleotide-binding universal stress UspA family protein
MFKNILIPVDFEINTEMAIKKAIELSEDGETTINLFHVQSKSVFSKLLNYQNVIYAVNSETTALSDFEKLNQWKNLIEENCPGINVIADIKKAPSIQYAIINKAKAIEADLVVICKHSGSKFFTYFNTVFPNHIAKMSGVPVLTFKPGSAFVKTKCIVVPIGPTIPKRKIDMLVTLKQKFRISIHLVTILKREQNSNEFSAYALMQTYKFLKNMVQCPLHHEVLHGDNVAVAALNYANDIKADMLLVEPEAETKLSAFPKKHINDELKPNSKLQILSIHS